MIREYAFWNTSVFSSDCFFFFFQNVQSTLIPEATPFSSDFTPACRIIGRCPRFAECLQSSLGAYCSSGSHTCPPAASRGPRALPLPQRPRRCSHCQASLADGQSVVWPIIFGPGLWPWLSFLGSFLPQGTVSLTDKVGPMLVWACKSLGWPGALSSIKIEAFVISHQLLCVSIICLYRKIGRKRKKKGRNFEGMEEND